VSAPVTRPERIGLIAWAALLVLQLVWHLWLFPSGGALLWPVLGLVVVPLLLPLLAIANVQRALLWIGILSLFYFCHGIAEGWTSSEERWLALVEIVLTLLLIGTLGAGVKRKPKA
jgi:uncharacterized membrane protein